MKKELIIKFNLIKLKIIIYKLKITGTERNNWKQNTLKIINCFTFYIVQWLTSYTHDDHSRCTMDLANFE